MEEIYSSLPVRLPEFNPTLHTLYQDWLEGQDSSQARKLLHTEYRDKSHGHAQPPHMQWWEERERLPLKTWMLDSYSIVLLPGPSHILKNCGWRRMTDQWLTSQKIILPFNHGGGCLFCAEPDDMWGAEKQTLRNDTEWISECSEVFLNWQKTRSPAVPAVLISDICSKCEPVESQSNNPLRKQKLLSQLELMNRTCGCWMYIWWVWILAVQYESCSFPC